MLLSTQSVVYDLWANQSDFRKSKLQSVTGRKHHSLSLRLSGEVVFKADGKYVISKKNSITFMPAETAYQTEVVEGGSMMLIHFCTLRNDILLRPAFFETNDAEVLRLFTELCGNYTADGAAHYRCMSLFYALLERLDRPRTLTPKYVREAKLFIDRNFAVPITVCALAEQAKMSEVHFRNEFKRYFGVTPLSYLKDVRINNAKHLLRSGYHTVTDVAMACGFESASYFSSEFKRMVGVTPSEYEKDRS